MTRGTTKPAVDANRHVMVMAYAFAPASPIGTMRTLRLVRRLHAEGWKATVLTVVPETYESDVPIDHALMRQVPAGCTLLHARVLRPVEAVTGLLRGMRRGGTSKPTIPSFGDQAIPRPPSLSRRVVAALDELTCIPDKSNGWIVPAVIQGVLAVVRHRPALLYSSSPPWSGQVAALVVAKATGLPWVADFRDPWARAPWRESQPERIRRAAVALERRVVARADAILFATQTNRDEYVNHYGAQIAGKCHVVRNGCDPDEFAHVESASKNDAFVLLHAGSLYGARTPVPLFRAIAAALQRGVIDRAKFKLRFIGALAGNSDFPSAAAGLDIQDVVEFLPRMPRERIVYEMAQASCLLVLQPGTTVSIPGKVYEYLAVGRPILSLSEEGETSNLVRESGLGLAVAADDEAAIERALVRLFMNRHQPVQRPPAHLYDGNVTAGDAVAVIEQVAGAARHDRETVISVGLTK
jgi:glycosyltransferase involved in cell wall biosynthesis